MTWDEPSPEQQRCGYAVYGPPAACTCGMCGVCPSCGGRGEVADYVGLEMKPVAVDCEVCHGTGKQ